MNLKLESIILFVQNVNKLKAFYVDILKLEIIEESKSQWLLVKAGNCCIGLHKIGEPYLDSNQDEFKFDNNTKLVFEIEDDIYKIREQLIKENVMLKEVITFDNYGYWLCDGEDPEGNVFQLRQRK